MSGSPLSSTFGGGQPPGGAGAAAGGRPLGGVPSLEDVRRVLSRSDKARPTTVDAQGLLVTACGRTIAVPEGNGVTLLLHHVQKALQDELGLPEQAFDINDRNGTRLRTDHDLREAVMSGRLPLNAKISDTSAKIQSIQSDIKWVCQQVGSLRGELESQKQEHTTELENLRTEVYSTLNSVLEASKMGKVSGGSPGSDVGGMKLDLINADQGIPLASMEHLANLENDIRSLDGRLEEMALQFRNTMSEYSRHHDRSSTQNSDAIARLVDRCAGLDARIANAEIGMASMGMRPKPREGPLNQSPAAFGRQSPEPGSLNRGPMEGHFNRSPGHSPEPSVKSMSMGGSMGGDFERPGPLQRMSVASHTSQSPTRLGGIGGGFTGPGRPGGPSAFGPGGGYPQRSSASPLGSGGSNYGLGTGNSSLGGSGQFSVGGSIRGDGGHASVSMSGTAPGASRPNRSHSPRFPIDKSTGSAPPGNRSLTPAGSAGGIAPGRLSNTGSAASQQHRTGLGPRPNSATESASVLRSRSGPQGPDGTNTGPSGSPKNVQRMPQDQPLGSGSTQGSQSQMAAAASPNATQLGKVLKPPWTVTGQPE